MSADFDTHLRRLQEKDVADLGALRGIVDAAVLAHVGFVVEGLPYVLPMVCAPWQDPAQNHEQFSLLLHGSTGSRLMRAVADGSPVCATITHLDGVVLARSAYESSMTYRSAMVMGTAAPLVGDQKEAAMAALVDHVFPDRRRDLRPTTTREFAATMLLELPVKQWSVKVGQDFAEDPADDLRTHGHTWAGLVPLTTGWGPPVPDPASTHLPVPEYLHRWPPPGSPR